MTKKVCINKQVLSVRWLRKSRSLRQIAPSEWRRQILQSQRDVWKHKNNNNKWRKNTVMQSDNLCASKKFVKRWRFGGQTQHVGATTIATLKAVRQVRSLSCLIRFCMALNTFATRVEHNRNVFDQSTTTAIISEAYSWASAWVCERTTTTTISDNKHSQLELLLFFLIGWCSADLRHRYNVIVIDIAIVVAAKLSSVVKRSLRV